MQKSVIIVAAGSGKRMGGQIPKQFIELKGLPVLMRTITRFYLADPTFRIVLVLSLREVSLWDKLCIKHNFRIDHDIAFGGETRYESVQNGIKHAGKGSLVAIHDGVRPLVSEHTIHRCFQSAHKKGNAIPVVNPPESIRINENGVSRALSREDIYLVQTPQVFSWEQIMESYHQPYKPEFTDDASVVENSGFAIHLVEGNPENIKITRPYDLKLATFLLDSMDSYSEESSL